MTGRPAWCGNDADDDDARGRRSWWCVKHARYGRVDGWATLKPAEVVIPSSRGRTRGV